LRLSTKTRYGVQAVFDIAFYNAGQPTQAKDIARRQEIPLRYLEQIFQDLKRAGLVDSIRGPRGGYFLKQPAEKIRLGDVVRALEGPIEKIFAAGDPEAKPRGRKEKELVTSSRHVTESMWRELAGQVVSWFDAVMISDMVKRGDELGVPRTETKRPMYFI
jgi:Rrf2 family protein